MSDGGDFKVECRTPTAGKAATRIATWKFELLEAAILGIVPREEPGIEFKALPARVRQALTAAELKRLGSVSWHTTTVKLELEVRGHLTRIDGSSPQRLIRTD